MLLGVDKEENEQDTIMILSLDKVIIQQNINYESMYVEQGEERANKINYAYHYGSRRGQFLIKMNYFNLDINKYALIDFDASSRNNRLF